MPQFRDNLPDGARTFEARSTVQWADCDAAGIIYFVAYWRFQELAEMQLFADLGFPFATVFDAFDFWLPRIRTEGEYYAPAVMGDVIRARLHIEKVGASSIRWRTVLFNETTGVVAAALALTVAAMDRATRKSMPLPSPMRAALLSTLP
jgi:acyl-CoA thioester hydrolase